MEGTKKGDKKEMMPYIVVFIISIGFFALSDRVKFTQRKPVVFVAVMILCLLAGLRAESIGTDTKVYLVPVFEAAKKCHSIGEYLNSSFHAFTWTTNYVKDLEPLFPSLVLIVTKITGSLYCVQTVLELCAILPLYVAVRKDKNTSLWMAMFVFCMAFYNPSMNMMRQSIAMSFGVLGFEYWRNETPRMLIAIGIGLAGMLLASAIVLALSSFGFGQYLSYVTGKLSFMPNQLLIRVPQIVLIIWSYRYLKDQRGDISFFLVMQVYVVLFLQFTSVSGYGGRIALYFAIFDVIVIPWAMGALKPVKSGIIIRSAIILYYMFYWWFYFVYSGTHQTVPYIFMN